MGDFVIRLETGETTLVDFSCWVSDSDAQRILLNVRALLLDVLGEVVAQPAKPLQN